MYLSQCERTKVLIVSLIFKNLFVNLLNFTSSIEKKNESDTFLGGYALQYQYNLSIIDYLLIRITWYNLNRISKREV